MGNFYENITLEGAVRQDVIEYLRKAEKDAFVSPALGHFTVIYPEMGMTTLARDLSQALQCVALFVGIYDDDVLMYELYSNGVSVDRYNSSPDAYGGEDSDLDLETNGSPFEHDPETDFETQFRQTVDANLLKVKAQWPAFQQQMRERMERETERMLQRLDQAGELSEEQKASLRASLERMQEQTRGQEPLQRLMAISMSMNRESAFPPQPKPPAGGDAATLCATLGVEADAERLTTILQDAYTFEVDRHSDLVEALGLPKCTVGLGYRYLMQGDGSHYPELSGGGGVLKIGGRKDSTT